MTKELEYFLNHSKYQLKHKKVHSVYFGGGTPSIYKKKRRKKVFLIKKFLIRFGSGKKKKKIKAIKRRK